MWYTGMILGLRPANERRRYKVTPSLIGWAQTLNQPWIINTTTEDLVMQGARPSAAMALT